MSIGAFRFVLGAMVSNLWNVNELLLRRNRLLEVNCRVEEVANDDCVRPCCSAKSFSARPVAIAHQRSGGGAKFPCTYSMNKTGRTGPWTKGSPKVAQFPSTFFIQEQLAIDLYFSAPFFLSLTSVFRRQ